ncbi:hypothetical protein BC829DRAFT_474702 [Chytridium lagenaria]|nr:hypothetical protein BC829DRAFT_474702 [Chytridium lagenaria]
MAAELIPAKTNAAMQNVVNRLGVRKAIVLLEDEVKESRHVPAPRSRRRTSIASDIGFQDIISKVNITYDMDKITPSSAPTFNLEQHGPSVKGSQMSLNNDSKGSLPDVTYTAPSEQPAQTTFFRRMSLGASELLRGFRASSSSGDGEQGVLPKVSAASLLPKSYVNSIYEEAEEDAEDAEEMKYTVADGGEKVEKKKNDEEISAVREEESDSDDYEPPKLKLQPLPVLPLKAPGSLNVELLPSGSRSVPTIDIKAELGDTKSTSQEAIPVQHSYWELSADTVPNRRASISLTPEIAINSDGTDAHTPIARSRQPSLSNPAFKGPMGLTVDGSGLGGSFQSNLQIGETMKPSRSIGALSIGGHVATPDNNPAPPRRRGSNASMLSSAAMVIPSSPSRSDLMKVQGFSTNKSGEIVLFSDGDRSADIDAEEEEAEYQRERAAVAHRDSLLQTQPQPRSRGPSMDRGTRNASVMIPKVPTMIRRNSAASKYTEVLSRMRGTNQPLKAAEVKSFGRVVQLAADLKKVGEDPNLVVRA